MPVDYSHIPLKHRAGETARVHATAVYSHAVTTGQLYEKHCTMARRKATEEEWALYIHDTVIPAYKREWRATVPNPKAVSAVAAEKLKQYYEDHVRELDESDVDDAVSAIIKAPKLTVDLTPATPFIKRVREEVEAPTTALEYKMGNIAAGFCIGLVTGILLGGYIVFLIIAK